MPSPHGCGTMSSRLCMSGMLHELQLPTVLLHLLILNKRASCSCRMASRCFWDNETDAYAFESFKNVSQPQVQAAVDGAGFVPCWLQLGQTSCQGLGVWSGS